MSDKSITNLTLMPGTSRGAPRSGRQLEIFPLHPGSNPARPEGGPRPAADLRSTPVRPALEGSEVTEEIRAQWQVDREAWAKVERARVQRSPVTGSTTRSSLQDPAIVTMIDEDEVDSDRLTTVEKVLASIGVPVALLLLITVI